MRKSISETLGAPVSRFQKPLVCEVKGVQHLAIGMTGKDGRPAFVVKDITGNMSVVSTTSKDLSVPVPSADQTKD